LHFEFDNGLAALMPSYSRSEASSRAIGSGTVEYIQRFYIVQWTVFDPKESVACRMISFLEPPLAKGYHPRETRFMGFSDYGITLGYNPTRGVHVAISGHHQDRTARPTDAGGKFLSVEARHPKIAPVGRS